MKLNSLLKVKLSFLQAEIEVLRLQKMKSSKIKEVLLKKKLHLDEICRVAHMVVDGHNLIDYSTETIESGKEKISSSWFYVEIILTFSQNTYKNGFLNGR